MGWIHNTRQAPGATTKTGGHHHHTLPVGWSNQVMALPHNPPWLPNQIDSPRNLAAMEHRRRAQRSPGDQNRPVADLVVHHLPEVQVGDLIRLGDALVDADHQQLRRAQRTRSAVTNAARRRRGSRRAAPTGSIRAALRRPAPGRRNWPRKPAPGPSPSPPTASPQEPVHVSPAAYPSPRFYAATASA